ncbi:PspA/IM30 family protein [Jeotgalibacillus sp. ET6]|uniref:PspA/IM30 family protein n=1 Tax=Jeotgalibacillus sp. ET6 TaxID=3037260 RepID=UPI002418A2E7|nr:PspA/IM30 family protein [Jeotgalibacillus sp. ET6]MDG5473279.1 PspA/IM30 family protein [Jeotgalibacillus sp. ET6]
MTNVLTRVAEAIKADFMEVSNGGAKSEPIQKLNRYLRECEAETDKVGKLVDRQKLLKKEFTKELEEASSMAVKREEHVKIAEEAGEAELAKTALRELTHYQGRKERLQLSLQDTTDQLHRLEEMHATMKHKLKDMYIKRLEVMGRENVAQANQKAEQTFTDDSGLTEEELRFKKIENYLRQLETGEKAEEEESIDQQIAQLQKRMKEETNISQ